MNIRSTTRVATVLDAHPEVEELFNWYEVSIGDDELLMTIQELCKAHFLDLDDLMVEIDAAIEDDDDEDDDDDMADFWRTLDDEEDDLDDEDFDSPPTRRQAG